MFRLIFVVFFLTFSLISAKSLALEVNDLYRFDVDVDDQSSEQREEAINEALQAVFLKVGGNKSVLEHKLLRRAIKRPNNFINQYRYQRKNDQLSIVVAFNEDKVNALFKQADLPLWGSLRPQVLLWLIDEQGDSRHIVAFDENTTIPETIDSFSRHRGLPIIMPLMDLTDNDQVVLSDLWAYFPDRVQQVSVRYHADTVIVMRISDSSLVAEEDKITETVFDDSACGILCADNEIKTPKALDWKVYTQDALYIQHYKGDDKAQLITQGLSDITELIFKSYALSTTSESDFVIEVNNVTSLKNDTQLFTFLSDLSGVNAVTLISAQADVRRFKLDLASSKESFLAALRLNDKLTQQFKVPEPTPTEEPTDSESLTFEDATINDGTLNDSMNQTDSAQLGRTDLGITDLGITAAENTEADNTEINNIGKNIEENTPEEPDYSHMTVIVLGVDPSISEAKEQTIQGLSENEHVAGGHAVINDPTIESPSVDNNGETLVIPGSTSELVPELTPGLTIDEHNLQARDADAQEEALIEEKTPLTIKPDVPVFYWEKG